MLDGKATAQIIKGLFFFEAEVPKPKPHCTLLVVPISSTSHSAPFTNPSPRSKVYIQRSHWDHFQRNGEASPFFQKCCLQSVWVWKRPKCNPTFFRHWQVPVVSFWGTQPEGDGGNQSPSQSPWSPAGRKKNKKQNRRWPKLLFVPESVQDLILKLQSQYSPLEEAPEDHRCQTGWFPVCPSTWLGQPQELDNTAKVQKIKLLFLSQHSSQDSVGKCKADVLCVYECILFFVLPDITFGMPIFLTAFFKNCSCASSCSC